MAKAFLSYVRAAKEPVRRLVNALRQAGIECWIDERDIAPGARWKKAIEAEIAKCDFFVACFSELHRIEDHPFMADEVRTALLRQQREGLGAWILPVALSGGLPPLPSDLHGPLSDLQWIHVESEGWSRAVDALVHRIQPRPAADEAWTSERARRFEQGSAAERRRVVRELDGLHHVPGALSLLRRALGDDDDEVSMNAGYFLIQAGSAGVEALVHAIGDTRLPWERRTSIAMLLGQAGTQAARAVPVLVGLARRLASSDEPNVVAAPLPEEPTGEEDADVARELRQGYAATLITVLASIGQPRDLLLAAFDDLQTSFPGLWRELASARRSVDPRAGSVHPTGEEVAARARALGSPARASEARRQLLEWGLRCAPALVHDHLGRPGVLDLLVEMGSAVVPILLGALRVERESGPIAVALARIGDPRATPELRAALERGHADAAQALAQVAGEDAIEDLAKAVRQDSNTRQAAAVALLTLGSDASITALATEIERSVNQGGILDALRSKLQELARLSGSARDSLALAAAKSLVASWDEGWLDVLLALPATKVVLPVLRSHSHWFRHRSLLFERLGLAGLRYLFDELSRTDRSYVWPSLARMAAALSQKSCERLRVEAPKLKWLTPRLFDLAEALNLYHEPAGLAELAGLLGEGMRAALVKSLDARPRGEPHDLRASVLVELSGPKDADEVLPLLLRVEDSMARQYVEKIAGSAVPTLVRLLEQDETHSTRRALLALLESVGTAAAHEALERHRSPRADGRD